jgi:DNA-binding response OmpR family regulator
MLPKMPARILVADDEPRYVRSIKIYLESHGYEVFTASNGQEALVLVVEQEPDLVLLDVRMPRMDGYEVCRRIREFSTVPIIMLTAMAEDADKVKGLDIGADDYVTKPFSAQELMARVRAALRRGGPVRPTDPALGSFFQAGDLKVDLAQQRVLVCDQEVELTPTEYRLLCAFVKNAGRVLVPEYLLEEVWGPRYSEDYHLVRQAVHRLRHKIEEDPQNPRYIQTRPHFGYIFVVPE